MVDGDPVNPGAAGGFAAKLAEFAPDFEKHIMRGVLGLGRVAEQPEAQIKRLAAVRLVKFGKIRRHRFQSNLS